MYIYNITFATEDKKLEKLLEWIRTKAVPALTVNGDATSPMIAKVVPSVCEEGTSDLTSVCLQLQFSARDSFEAWQEEIFPGVMQQYSELFAPEPLFFASLLEKLPL